MWIPAGPAPTTHTLSEGRGDEEGEGGEEEGEGGEEGEAASRPDKRPYRRCSTRGCQTVGCSLPQATRPSMKTGQEGRKGGRSRGRRRRGSRSSSRDMVGHWLAVWCKDWLAENRGETHAAR